MLADAEKQKEEEEKENGDDKETTHTILTY